MGQSNEEKILRVYFENSGKGFTIRELSRLTKIPRSTVQNKLVSLKKDRLINRENMAEDNKLFRIKKINYYVEEIVKSGLINFLVEKLNPSCIILFGSFRKGEYDKESDIDLFVESPFDKKLDLKKFERKLSHKIDLFVEKNIKNLDSNLFNNIVNGIKLYGSFKVK